MTSKPVIVLLILIFLALVANLVFVAVTDQSFLTDEIVAYGLFGALILANCCVAGAGLHFVSRSLVKYEKSSLHWARRAYVAILVVIVLLGAAPWAFMDVGTERYTRQDALFDASLLLLLFGVPTALFTMAYYRDYRRISGSRMTGGRGQDD